MRWILEHFQLVIVLAGALAWWLNQRKREKAGQSADYDDDGIPERNEEGSFTGEASYQDDEEARMREEIRRKREARQGGQPTPPSVPRAPSPVEDPLTQLMRELASNLAPKEPQRPVAPPPVPAAPSYAEQELERQRALQERLATLPGRTTHSSFPQAAPALTATGSAVLSPAPVSELRASLQDVAQVRRAILLSEVLGKPLALR